MIAIQEKAGKKRIKTKSKKSEYCKGCFTGKYPIPVQLEMDKLTLEKGDTYGRS